MRTVFRRDCSPGPGYFVQSSITRFGNDGTPTYSILGRAKDPSKCSTVKFSTGTLYSCESIDLKFHEQRLTCSLIQIHSRPHLLVPTTLKRFTLREKNMLQHTPWVPEQDTGRVRHFILTATTLCTIILCI